MSNDISEKSELLQPEDETESHGERQRATTYEEAISKAGYGWFHYRLLILCGWALSSDAIEVLSISFILPPATCELRMTDSEKGFLNASMFLGMMIGGYMWGILSDKYGRRAVLVWSLSMNALGGLCSSLAQTFWLFVLLRIFSGVGVGGSLPVIFSYFTEFQPKNKRGSMISLLATFWMAGNIVAAGLAWIVIPHQSMGVYMANFTYSSWRIYLAICTLPALTSALMFVLQPESPKFLIEKGRTNDALAVMVLIHRGNKRCKSSSAHAQYEVSELERPEREDPRLFSDHSTSWYTTVKNKASQIFETTVKVFQAPLTSISITMCIIFFTLCFGYYGLFMWFPELFNRMETTGGSPCQQAYNVTKPKDICNGSQYVDSAIYLESFVVAVSNLPGNILTILIIDKVGRKILLASSMVLSGVSVFFIYFLKSKTHSIIMSCVFNAVSVIGFNALDVLSAELYPTALRSTANGVLSGISRVAAILGNIVFGELVTANCAIPMLMVAALLTVGGLSSIRLPNYTNRDLH